MEGHKSEFPKEEEILRIGEQRGKFPFVFLNDNLLAIEEGQSALQWRIEKMANYRVEDFTTIAPESDIVAVVYYEALGGYEDWFTS